MRVVCVAILVGAKVSPEAVETLCSMREGQEERHVRCLLCKRWSAAAGEMEMLG